MNRVARIVLSEQFLSSRLNKCGVELLLASDIAQDFRLARQEAPSVIVSVCGFENNRVND